MICWRKRLIRDARVFMLRDAASALRRHAERGARGAGGAMITPSLP